MICGSGGSKSKLDEAAGAEPPGQMRNEKLHAVVARALFQVKLHKTHQLGPLLEGRCRKSARCCGAKTFSSQNAQNTMFGPFLEECVEKVHTVVARSTVTKHTNFGPLLEVKMSKKCTLLWREAHFQVTKRTSFGPLLEVRMSKNCTPLWHEAHFQASAHFWRHRCRKSALFQVKMHKSHYVRTIFGGIGVEKAHSVVARSTFSSQNTLCSDHFRRNRCRKSAHVCGAKHIAKSNAKSLRVSEHFWRVDRWIDG